MDVQRVHDMPVLIAVPKFEVRKIAFGRQHHPEGPLHILHRAIRVEVHRHHPAVGDGKRPARPLRFAEPGFFDGWSTPVTNAGRRLAPTSLFFPTENIIDIQFAVQYNLIAAEAFVFNNRRPEEIVKVIAESAIRFAAEGFADVTPMQVSAPIASLRKAPEPDAEQEDQLVFGELFDVLFEVGDFAFGQARRDREVVDRVLGVGGGVGHPGDAGELVERLQEHEDRARDDARRAGIQSIEGF